jgi:hypothetical protein
MLAKADLFGKPPDPTISYEIDMSKKYNVAIIGYGWAASAHIAAINASNQAQVTAVWSSRFLDSSELSAKHGSPIRAYTDLAAMLADPTVHVVDITATPISTRRSLLRPPGMANTSSWKSRSRSSGARFFR